MVITYGKKPRASKTSEFYEIDGLKLFIYNTKTATKGNAEIYMAEEPYFLISVARDNATAKMWIDSTLKEIVSKISEAIDASVGVLSKDVILRDDFMKPKSRSVKETKYDNMDIRDTSCTFTC